MFQHFALSSYALTCALLTEGWEVQSRAPHRGRVAAGRSVIPPHNRLAETYRGSWGQVSDEKTYIYIYIYICIHIHILLGILQMERKWRGSEPSGLPASETRAARSRRPCRKSIKANNSNHVKHNTHKQIRSCRPCLKYRDQDLNKTHINNNYIYIYI